MEAVATSKINDTIWITSRVRMIAERKSLRNQNISFLAVTYYSVFSVILSIFNDYYDKPYPALNEINLSASIVVLVASLVAAGFRLEARAGAFRECYLKLQRLYDEELSEAQKKMKYREIMLDFPNHSPRDYADLLVNHILLEEKELTSGGKTSMYTRFMAISFFTRNLLYWMMLAVLFLGPVIFLLWPIFCYPSA
ncbi:SLATT domain-containing protein [Rhizobium binxianense]